MTGAIDIDCADPTLGAAVERWLDEGRLEPPIRLKLEISVGPVDAAAGDGSRPSFHQPGVTILSGGSDRRVTISWDSWPAIAELAPGSTTAVVRLSPQAAARLDECLRQFMIVVLIFLLRRAGWHHVHGAITIDPRGRGWLLAGNSRAGKSTTAALAASRGWAVGTDDIAFLAQSTPDRVEARAFRTRLALRPGGEDLLARSGGLPLEGRGKVGFWPEELGGSWIAQIEPEVLLFTQIGAGETTVEPMRPGDVLAELVRWSAWVALEPELAQGHLDLLSRLGAQARAFRVTLGRDLFDQPDRLERLVS